MARIKQTPRKLSTSSGMERATCLSDVTFVAVKYRQSLWRHYKKHEASFWVMGRSSQQTPTWTQPQPVAGSSSVATVTEEAAGIQVPPWHGSRKSCAGQSLISTVVGTCGQLVEACWTYHESSCRHMEDVHSATPALPLGTLFLTI